jgi:hypothetical protein
VSSTGFCSSIESPTEVVSQPSQRMMILVFVLSGSISVITKRGRENTPRARRGVDSRSSIVHIVVRVGERRDVTGRRNAFDAAHHGRKDRIREIRDRGSDGTTGDVFAGRRRRISEQRWRDLSATD